MSIVSGAIESLCKSLAIELAPIRVNTVCPGFKTLSELEDKIPLGLGSDSQMANPYLFLMNDDYITGASIVSDGGGIDRLTATGMMKTNKNGGGKKTPPFF